MNRGPLFYFPRVAIITIAALLIVLTPSCNDDPEPLAVPQVNAISPTSGLINTPITITGTKFSTVLTENKVTFNGKEAVVTIATATQLTTTVPLTAGTGPVSVIVKDLAASNQPIFTVESAFPEVSKISPASGLTNTPVIITGTKFSTVLTENKVTFNGKEAVVTIATATQLTATVPLFAETGPVVVTVKDITATNQPVFTVDSPTPEVTEISPASGPINTPVIITGKNFSAVLAENKVTFNGKEAAVTVATATQLTATVPMLAETGPVVVTVKGKVATNQPVFTIVSIPVLTTSDVITVTPLTATGGGDVTSDGGAPIISRGLCWSTNPTPTIDDSKTVDGTGTGAFTSSITGLTEGSVYYARAYATNNAGTAYGTEMTFTALVIGQNYKGGILGYLLQPGDLGYCAGEAHGIVVSHYSSAKRPWSYVANTRVANIRIGTKTALGTGKANTDRIVRDQQFPRTLEDLANISAAQICFYIIKNEDYMDWYLPSKDELNKLYINKDKLPGFTKEGQDYYWSSSEVSSSEAIENEAWIQSFTTGKQSTYDKIGKMFFSPIRSF
jgi:hypothetical protein